MTHTRTLGTWITRRVGLGSVVIAAMVVATSVETAAARQPERLKELQKRGQAFRSTVDGTARVTGTKPNTAAGLRNAGKSLQDVPPGTPRPVIKAIEDVHDFGTLWVGPKLQHTFKIRNDGKAILKIKRVKPACGCTIAGTYPRTLQPGEVGEFPFSIASQKLHGRFEKAVTITTNDPVTPNLRLRLRGVVKRYLDLAPASVQFPKLFGGEPSQREVTITNNTEQPLELTLDKSPGKGFDIQITPVKPGQVYKITVIAKPPFEPGVFRKVAVFKTNIEAQKTVKLDIRGSVPQRLEINPRILTLGALRGARSKGRQMNRQIRFTNYGATDVKVTGATIDDREVTVSVNELRPGKAYTIRVQFPAGYELPITGRTITILTTDATQPKLQVSVRSLGARTAKIKKTPPKRPASGLIGKKAPAIALTTTDGKSVSNADFASHPATVLNFFAPNCGYCKKAMPTIEKVRKEYEAKGVRFVNVAQKMRKDYTDKQIKDILKATGSKLELTTSDFNANSMGAAFRARSFPTMVIVGKSGKVAAVNIGALADLESRMKSQLDALIAGKPVPTIAKVAKVAKKPAARTPTTKRVDAASLIGKPAPKLALTTLKGKSVSNGDFGSHPATVLNFFAPNCGYCKKAMPAVEKVRKEYEAKGVRFVNVAEKMRKEYTNDQILDILKATGAGLEVTTSDFATNSVGRSFGASGFPTMVIVGKNGKIASVNIGAMRDLEKRMKAQLDALIAGKPIPAKYVAKPRKARTRPAEGLVGKPAPQFALTTVAGKSISSKSFSKHPAIVLNFVAPNCGYCKKALPSVEKVRKEYESKGVRFVNIVQKMRKDFTPEQIQTILKGAGSGLEITLGDFDSNSVGRSYKAQSFPTMIVVGRDGKIAAVNVGAKANLDTLLKSQLDALLKG